MSAVPELFIIVAGERPELVMAAVADAGPRCCLLCEAPGSIGLVFLRPSAPLVVATRACASHGLFERPVVEREALERVLFATTPAEGGVQ